MIKQKLPPGWDEQRVGAVLAHYENQTEDEQLAEYRAALRLKGHTTMVVPTALVPRIRALLAEHRSKLRKVTNNRRKATVVSNTKKKGTR
jgi:hypothetical protein